MVSTAFAALAAVLIGFVTAPYGPGATPDSVTYLSVARSLVEGEGWVRFDGRAYASWPPLYPLVLAAGAALGLPPETAARAVGALACALTLAAVVWILARVTGHLFWAMLGGLLTLASPPVVETFATAWSEGLFTALVTLAFAAAVRAGRQPGPRSLVAMALLVGAAWLTRHVGAVVAAALAAWLLALPGSGRDRARRALLFGGVSAALPLLWAAATWLRTGTPAGERGNASAPLTENVAELARSLASLTSLDALGAAGPWLAAGVVLGVATAGLWMARSEADGPPAVPALPAAVVWLYVVALVGLATWTPVAPLFGQRFGMPVWVPFVLVAVFGAARLWQRRSARGPRAALALVVAAATLHAMAATASRVGEHRERGVVMLGRAEWHASGLIEAVRGQARGRTVLSNNPHAVHFHTGLPVDYAPRRRGFRSEADEVDTIGPLRARVAAEGSVPLAWFLFYGRSYGYYTPQELAAEGFCLVAQDEFADGITFEITDPARCSGPRVIPPRSRAREAGR
jgi:4-amino-4-deoxy-L-arabinose transferase-like glycosyltransferase